MRPLQVDPAALRLLAVRCRDWATDLLTPSQVEFGSMPATAAAIATVHSCLNEASGVLAARIRQTADLIDDAAESYRDDDSRSATALRECVIRT